MVTRRASLVTLGAIGLVSLGMGIAAIWTRGVTGEKLGATAGLLAAVIYLVGTFLFIFQPWTKDE